MSEPSSRRDPDRREVLMAAAAAAGVATLAEFAEAAAPDKPAPPFIDAYADRLSYQAGDHVALHVSTSAPRYAVEVARVGKKRQLVFTKDDLAGTKHPVPDDAYSHGCRWPAALKIPVAEEWPSGYYQILLRGADDGRKVEGEAFFVVRAARPAKDARILLQLCTNTYNAYNRWGGSSLYGGTRGVARRVSFERPYMGFLPEDNFTNLYSGWRRWERPFVEWAEGAG